jgi:putative ABC transport system permease protein
MGFWSRADQQFANAGRTFVMTSEWHLTDGSETGSGVALPLTTHRLGDYLQSDFPRIEAVARVAAMSDKTPVQAGDRAMRMRAFAADAEFLGIFDLPFIEGDRRTALSAPGSVILTKETAESLFGEAHAIGKSITLYGGIDATVTGVLDRIPDPSHMGRSASAPLRFEVLASRDVYERFLRLVTGGRDSTELPDEWAGGGQNTTYVLLPADGSFTAAMLRDQLPAFVARHVPEDQTPPDLRRA